jgi:bifunctional UDP-N-acetylglucosamine pyrophosphorylase/glucosamine-1-phosphate N-acetyltransferase
VPNDHASPTVLVLAAGQGKRMHSKTVKLLHPVAGRPMLDHVLDAARALRPARLVTVIGHQAERVREALGERAGRLVLQREQRGTGHAVLQAARHVGREPGAVLVILNGDVPAIRPATLRTLLARHRRAGAALTVLTTEVEDPTGYGRIVRGVGDRVQRIVEHADAGADERRIREINCGIYCADPAALFAVLRRLRPHNVQREIYLTDAVVGLLGRHAVVSAMRHDEPGEVLGVNTRVELAAASARIYARKATELQEHGVTLLDAGRTWIDPRARIGRDSVIWPDVIIEGETALGEDCIVRPGCRIADCRIGRRVEVRDHSVLLGSEVGEGAAVGPFAHLRPGSQVGAAARVGNFVELKKTVLGPGSKASHLAYLGDAVIGPGCNIGAGTITCNFDGKHKHVTTLGRGVFVGSDAQLVAPVTLRDGAYVAAGTTVTEDVPAGALAIGRGRQRNIRGWVARRAKRQ